MFKAYKIRVDNDFESLAKAVDQQGDIDETYNKICINNSSISSKLEGMIRSSSTEKLSAESIWDEWFPEVNADVFISHSSKDADMAQRFAILLKAIFHLDSFIDSEIWGHSDDLLKKIDDEYCPHSNGTSYSYELRNGSTAHVHMMLSYALTRMIDKTECFIFLETDNSVTVNDSISGTYSPWIFHELATVDTIESKRKRLLVKEASESLQNFCDANALKVEYPILGKRLTEVDIDLISKWHNSYTEQSGKHALDILYKLA